MSRAFVKETDQEEAIVIPPRAALPAGVDNYVTPTGLDELRTEAAALNAEKEALDLENEDEQRRALTLLNGKLALLTQRINSARLIDPEGQPQEEVRFGATVNILYVNENEEQSFQIVGVDEADVSKNKIAFVAPVARALNGLWVKEETTIRLGKQARLVRILDIRY
jgi:transcription elongation factor GreB